MAIDRNGKDLSQDANTSVETQDVQVAQAATTASDAAAAQVIRVEPGARIELPDVNLADATLTLVGNDLTITLADGTVILLQDFVIAAQSDTPPELIFADGLELSSGDMLAAAVAQTAPAAGPAAGPAGAADDDGTTVTPEPQGPIGEGFGITGPLGPTSLSFAPPEVEVNVVGGDTDAEFLINEISLGSGGFTAGGNFNVIYIVDVSGSMSGPEMPATQTALKALNQSIIDAGVAANTEVAIIPFNGGIPSGSRAPNYFDTADQDTDGVGANDIDEYIDGLYPGGGTNFTPPLQVAQSWLLEDVGGAARYEGHQNVIFFISDGFGGFNPGDAGIQELYNPSTINADINSFGITASSDVFGNLDLVDNLQSDGSATQVIDPEDLSAALTGDGVFVGGPSYIELLNNTDDSNAILTGDYTLSTVGPDGTPVTFELPDTEVPPGGYLVLWENGTYEVFGPSSGSERGVLLEEGSYVTEPWGWGSDTTEPLGVNVLLGGSSADSFLANGVTLAGSVWSGAGASSASPIMQNIAEAMDDALGSGTAAQDLVNNDTFNGEIGDIDAILADFGLERPMVDFENYEVEHPNGSPSINQNHVFARVFNSDGPIDSNSEADWTTTDDGTPGGTNDASSINPQDNHDSNPDPDDFDPNQSTGQPGDAGQTVVVATGDEDGVINGGRGPDFMYGSGLQEAIVDDSESVVLRLSQDQYDGPPNPHGNVGSDFEVYVDNTLIGSGTVTAATGVVQEFTFTHPILGGGGSHEVYVEFTSDNWNPDDTEFPDDPTPGEGDRNLHLEQMTVNGIVVLEGESMYADGNTAGVYLPYDYFYAGETVIFTSEDLLAGGDHNDFLFGDAGDDLLSGGVIQFGDKFNDFLIGGGGGADVLVDVDYVIPSEAPDGTAAAEVQIGFGEGYVYGGNDMLVGGNGEDLLITASPYTEEYYGPVLVAEAAQVRMEEGLYGDILVGDSVLYADFFDYKTEPSVTLLPFGEGTVDIDSPVDNDVILAGNTGDLIFGDNLGLSEPLEDELDTGDPGALYFAVKDAVKGKGDPSSEFLDWLWAINADGADAEATSAGDDNIDAGGGADIVFGQGGDDEILAGTGGDIVFGGHGDDLIDGQGALEPYHSTWSHVAADEWLFGDEGDDIIVDDTTGGVLSEGYTRIEVEHHLSGGEGQDILDSTVDVTADSGIYGSAFAEGWNVLDGGDDDDQMIADADASAYSDGEGYGADATALNDMWGGDGNDYMEGYASATASGFYADASAENDMWGDAGNDYMEGYANADASGYDADAYADNDLFGNAGKDSMWGRAYADADGYDADSSASNYMEGYGDNDYMYAYSDADADGYGADANADNDMWGGDGADRMSGYAYADATADASGSADASASNSLYGNDGNDSMTARADAEADGYDADASAMNNMEGHDGNDSMTADADADASGHYADATAMNSMWGGDGDDTMTADADATAIGTGSAMAWADNDMWGGAGDDTMTADASALAVGSTAYANNYMSGDYGNDTMSASADAEASSFGEGGTAYAYSDNWLYGGYGDDDLSGSASAVAINDLSRFGYAQADADNIGYGNDGSDNLDFVAIAVAAAGDAWAYADNTLYADDMYSYDDDFGTHTINGVADAEAYGVTAHADAGNRAWGAYGDDTITLHAEADASAEGSASANADNSAQGYDGNDTIVATADADATGSTANAYNYLYGGYGSDDLTGTADASATGDGGDAATANADNRAWGDDSSHGGGGTGLNDTIGLTANATATNTTATANADADNTAWGYDGDDTMTAAANADASVSGESSAYANATNGLYGGYGNDDITGNATASATSDFGYASAGADNFAYGNDGNDTINLNAMATANGDNSNAYAYNTADGDSGNDTINANAMATAFGEGGYASAQNYVHGDEGNDTIDASAVATAVDGSANADNWLYGGDGNDTLTAYAEVTGLSGSADNHLYGGNGNDTLNAHAVGGSANYMYGDDGEDTFHDGAGANHMYAGFEDGDTDTFIFDTAYLVEGTDMIHEFEFGEGPGTDVLDLSDLFDDASVPVDIDTALEAFDEGYLRVDNLGGSSLTVGFDANGDDVGGDDSDWHHNQGAADTIAVVTLDGLNMGDLNDLLTYNIII